MAPTIAQWIMDTRTFWPEAGKTAELKTHASRALALLTDSEQEGVLRYYHVADAKMSLCSHLLKHYVVSKLGGVPWRHTTVTRDAHTKPIYRDPVTGRQPVAFNVSHQAGLVAVVAVAGYGYAAGERDGETEVGVDLVCVGERRDRDQRMIRADGWPRFVDMHADVFARSEADYLKYHLLSSVRPGPPPGATPEQVADFKLRAFYALWNLREAWVKMTGEALLAEWLGVLEFRHFRPPKPTASFAESLAGAEGGEEEEEDDGEDVIKQHEIVFRGKPVDDANVSQRSMGPDFMVCTAVRTPKRKEDGLSWRLGRYKLLALDEVLDFAEAQQ